MKTLYLLRHAKSSWDDDSLPDRERPLSPRGRRAAPAMGRYMADHGLVPDRVLCSPAVRTRQTWELVGPLLGDPPVAHPDALYGASARRILDLVRKHGGDADGVLVVGHNPGMEDLALALAGRGPDEALERMAAKYSTAALAVIRFDTERWPDVAPGTGELGRFVKPRDLERGDR